MERMIGLKLSEEFPVARCVPVIQQYEKLSITEIKRRITAKEPVCLCDFSDPERLKCFIACCDELERRGISCDIYGNGRSCSLESLKELDEVYDMIPKEPS